VKMTKKIKPSSGVKADATARAELVAKASYERKHTSTEVIPPDVTRAKAGAWLDIISPITEWAGLKGDALRYRRQQLRIQQEAALERLAHTIEQKMRGRRATTPLSPKVLVPALEAASLEDPESPLIAWWANLLVSGATGAKIRPYLIDLMGAIGPEEAECLSKMWKGISSNSDYLTAQFDLKLSAAFRAKESLQEELENFEEKSTGEEQFNRSDGLANSATGQGSTTIFSCDAESYLPTAMRCIIAFSTKSLTVGSMFLSSSFDENSTGPSSRNSFPNTSSAKLLETR